MTTFLKYIMVLCFCLSAFTAISQSRDHLEDSIAAQNFVDSKLKNLQSSGVVNYLYLFSDAGSIAILYEMDNKICAIKSYYKGSRNLFKFKNLKLSKEDKLNYRKCIDSASMDTVISFSNCKDYVHSFNRVVFLVNKDGHYLKGDFTSDCSSALEISSLLSLFSIYKHLLI